VQLRLRLSSLLLRVLEPARETVDCVVDSETPDSELVGSRRPSPPLAGAGGLDPTLCRRVKRVVWGMSERVRVRNVEMQNRRERERDETRQCGDCQDGQFDLVIPSATRGDGQH